MYLHCHPINSKKILSFYALSVNQKAGEQANGKLKAKQGNKAA
jgi:hypothetical protein